MPMPRVARRNSPGETRLVASACCQMGDEDRLPGVGGNRFFLIASAKECRRRMRVDNVIETAGALAAF